MGRLRPVHRIRPGDYEDDGVDMYPGVDDTVESLNAKIIGAFPDGNYPIISIAASASDIRSTISHAAGLRDSDSVGGIEVGTIPDADFVVIPVDSLGITIRGGYASQALNPSSVMLFPGMVVPTDTAPYYQACWLWHSKSTHDDSRSTDSMMLLQLFTTILDMVRIKGARRVVISIPDLLSGVSGDDIVRTLSAAVDADISVRKEGSLTREVRIHTLGSVLYTEQAE